MLSFVRQLPAGDEDMRGGFKAAALSSAAASWEGGVVREFACPKPSKAGLCPWPLIRHTACVVALKEMISRVLDSSAVDIRKARAHFVSRA